MAKSETATPAARRQTVRKPPTAAPAPPPIQKQTSLQPVSGLSRREQRAEGRAARIRAPRSSHAKWEAAPHRADPLELLARTNRSRVTELVPIRYGRMLASPFAYLRGSPGVMAADFAGCPSMGIRVQACGDAHVMNFGMFATPERNLVFDVNDFDETLPAPWEWDLKRLVVSAVVAGREIGMSETYCRAAAVAGSSAYRELMAQFATASVLDIWYSKIDVDKVMKSLDKVHRKKAKKTIKKARTRTSMQALKKLTYVVNGEPRIKDDPPLIEHVPEDARLLDQVEKAFNRYRSTLEDERAHLLDQFRFVDIARKVVGVGSVGTRCAVILMAGKSDGTPLFLQVKEAEESVLEAYAGPSGFGNHAHRVVQGQRLMQAASDLFLGWTKFDRRAYYVRQLRDMKGGAELDGMDAAGLIEYTALCGYAMARAHARTCEPSLISGYMGTGEVFDQAIASFAVAYADQNEIDYERLIKAVKSGKVHAVEGR